tara:strand:- start:175 stop:642 length:468 start_codon:yes stop_codon:yes gene_type:complete
MKITDQQLKRIIKEELNKVLSETYEQYIDLKDLKGPQHYQALPVSTVENILQDPNIPQDHKQKLAKLFQQGPEGKKQALQLMKAMGYEGVDATITTQKGPHEEIRNPFEDPPDIHPIRRKIYAKDITSPFMRAYYGMDDLGGEVFDASDFDDGEH